MTCSAFPCDVSAVICTGHTFAGAQCTWGELNRLRSCPGLLAGPLSRASYQPAPSPSAKKKINYLKNIDRFYFVFKVMDLCKEISKVLKLMNIKASNIL